MKRILIGVFFVSAFLVGCGGGDGSSTQDLIDAFVAQGAPEAEAKCVAAKLDGVSVKDVAGFASATAPGDIDQDVLAKIGVAVAECGIGG